MSAVLLNPKRNLPALPSELWLDIFRFATWVPLVLDPDAVLEFSPSSARERRRLYKQSLVTKRYLVRVCKKWNSMASPYLYEGVLVGRGKALRNIRDTLITSCEREREKNSEDGHSFGWWVKRLDVMMRDAGSPGDGIDIKLKHLSEIIHCLPNLTILIFCVTTQQFDHVQLPTFVLQSLVQSCGSNLQAISWQNDNLLPSAKGWYILLNGTRKLSAIGCDGGNPEGGWIQRLTIPSIQSLFFCPQNTVLRANLPSLRRIIINVVPHTDWALLRSHGAKLEVVQLYFLSSTLISHALATLTSICPKISRLDISVTSWELIGQCDVMLPPTIQTLGIQSMHKQSTKRGYDDLFRGLQNIQPDSKLESIQFLDTRNLVDLRQRHPQVFLRGLELLRRRGVKIKDPEGSVVL